MVFVPTSFLLLNFWDMWIRGVFMPQCCGMAAAWRAAWMRPKSLPRAARNDASARSGRLNAEAASPRPPVPPRHTPIITLPQANPGTHTRSEGS